MNILSKIKWKNLNILYIGNIFIFIDLGIIYILLFMYR